LDWPQCIVFTVLEEEREGQAPVPTIMSDAEFSKKFGTECIDASTNKKLSLAPKTNEKEGEGVCGRDPRTG
jgi:hypothetical protein